MQGRQIGSLILVWLSVWSRLDITCLAYKIGHQFFNLRKQILDFLILYSFDAGHIFNEVFFFNLVFLINKIRNYCAKNQRYDLVMLFTIPYIKKEILKELAILLQDLFLILHDFFNLWHVYLFSALNFFFKLLSGCVLEDLYFDSIVLIARHQLPLAFLKYRCAKITILNHFQICLL